MRTLTREAALSSCSPLSPPASLKSTKFKCESTNLSEVTTAFSKLIRVNCEAERSVRIQFECLKLRETQCVFLKNWRRLRYIDNG